MKKILLILSLLSTVGLFGCNNNSINDKTIVVGASSVPHKGILEEAKSFIGSKGYKLKIVVYDDYVLPNKGVQSEELDANFFQHEPYLLNFNKENKTKLAAVLEVHYEPLAIYKGKKDSLENVYDIAIPNDNTNRARALLLLEANGLIELDRKEEDIDLSNIIDYKGHKIVEVDAASIPAQKTDLLICNGNYALAANIAGNIIVNEDSNSVAPKYTNIIAVKEKYKDKEAIKVLVDALSQENIKAYIEDTYKGTIVYSLKKR